MLPFGFINILKSLMKNDTLDLFIVAVHPDYRGQKLQWKLMQEAEKSICQKHRGILLCTVHPDNRYSLQNVLKQDYTIVKKKEKYGSVRYILRKDLP